MGLVGGMKLDRNFQAAFYLLFQTTSMIGETFYYPAINSWLIEVTSGQDEFLRAKYFYNFIAIIIGGTIASPLIIVMDLAEGTVVLLSLLSIVSAYYFFTRCRIKDQDEKFDRQDPLLGTVRSLISNPYTKNVLTYTILIGVGNGLGSFSLITMLNYKIIPTVAASSFFNLIFGFLLVIVTIPVYFLITMKLGRKEWDFCYLIETSTWCSGILFILLFPLVSLLNKDYEPTVGVIVFFVIAMVIFVSLSILSQIGLDVYTRKGCKIDLAIRGVNSFGQYIGALGICNNFVNTIVNGLNFVAFERLGYSQYDDDTLDDRVDTRYDVSDASLWYLRVTNTLPIGIVLISMYFLARRLRPIIRKIEEVEEEIDNAQPKQEDIDKKREEEVMSSISSPMHSDTMFEGTAETGVSIPRIVDALKQFSDRELACFAYVDDDKRKSHMRFIKSVNVLTIFFACSSSFLTLYLTAVCLIGRYTTFITIILMVFIFESLNAFYEMLKFGPFGVIYKAFSSEGLVEQVRRAIVERKSYIQDINHFLGTRVASVSDDTGQVMNTKMTTDKVVKSCLCIKSILTSFVLLVLIIRYS